MSARMVKYCPLCGAANDPAEPFCTACQDGELISIAVQPLRAHAPAPVQPAPPASAPAATAATSAGPNTQHIESEPAPASLVLELIERPELRFTIQDGQSVGASREPARMADVTLAGVPELDYISSVHARLFRRGEQWYVQHLGSTNYVKVDGMKFEKREEVPVHHGTVLVLSKTPFRVLIGGT